MFKNYSKIIALFVFFLGLLACSSSTSEKELIKKYQLAKDYNDTTQMIDVIYDKIIKYPTDLKWQDTLANLYFKQGNWESAYLVSSKVLRQLNNDSLSLYIAAVSSFRSKNYGPSLQYNLRCYEKDNSNIVFQYNLAALYLKNANKKLSLKFIEKVINHPDNQSYLVEVEDVNGPIYIKYNAAAYSLAGYFYFNSGDLDSAKKFYTLAYKEAPNFELAKDNISYINELFLN